MAGTSNRSGTTRPEGSAEELARALARIARDPGATCRLHDVFGGFCHQFRNLLNSLKITLYLAKKHGAPGGDDPWSGLEPRYALAERFIDRFQLICRPMTLNLVRLPIDALFQDREASWSTLLNARGKRLRLGPGDASTPGAFDPMRLGAGLDDLVIWRARAGNPAADLRVRWSADAAGFCVEWDEPCPTDSTSPDPGGPSFDLTQDTDTTSIEADVLAALTVPLLTRVMTSHHGALVEGGPGPWSLTLRWPLDARPTQREAPPCSASPPSR